jgi:hypothetical protein
MFERRQLMVGSLALLLAAAAYWPVHPQSPEWVELLILLAVLLLVPMGFARYLPGRLPLGAWLLPGLALGLAMWLPPSWLAGALALPWLALSAWAWWRHAGFRRVEERLFSFALLFWNVAAAWAAAHAWGWQPLGFAPIIVLLTAAHFHYAGFLLLLLLALAYREGPSLWLRALGGLAVAGISAVALAITLSRLSGWVWGEALSGPVMAAAGGLAALHYWRQARQRPPFTRWCWHLGSSLLLCGMALALGYALRPALPIPFLDIPNMYAWHGTGNAVGLGLLVVGWGRVAWRGAN